MFKRFLGRLHAGAKGDKQQRVLFWGRVLAVTAIGKDRSDADDTEQCRQKNGGQQDSRHFSHHTPPWMGFGKQASLACIAKEKRVNVLVMMVRR